MEKNSSAPAGVDAGRLRTLVESVLTLAKSQGASAAEAGVNVESGLSVDVRLGEVETLEHNRDKGMGVTVYFGQRKGSASTTDFSDTAMADTVRAACAIAQHTAEDECAGLAPADRMATEIPDLQLFHPWDIGADEAIDMARACEATALERDERITNSEGAAVSTHSGYRVYGNSHGFLGGYATSRHSMSCTVIGEDEAGMQRDYWYSVARDPADLEAAEAIGQHAAERTLQRLDARRIKTGQMPVIFQADIARGLIGHFIRAINGSSLYRQASFMLDQLGEQVFPDWFVIDERPHLLKGLGSAPFDSEGVATGARELVRDGVLEGYVLDSYAARRLNMQSTGNAGGTHNVFVQHQDLDFAALIKKMQRGVVVTELMGQGVNPVTGDYSRGASGFYVENGEIQYPVEEITVAGNLRNMYRGILAVANDVDRRGNLCSGSILVEEMTVAGE